MFNPSGQCRQPMGDAIIRRNELRRQQEEQDRRLAEEYASLEIRNEQQRLKSAARTENNTPSYQKISRNFSEKKLGCGGHRYAVCKGTDDDLARARCRYPQYYGGKTDAKKVNFVSGYDRPICVCDD
ncbi:hypothetical protein I4U23_022006 [Adineta vaga]|nr:hypothetical protein I4U23_022006 [Adineta vaga]